MTDRHATLWGGPEDGASVLLPPGELPARIGVHRTADGLLVPIRGRALVLEVPGLPVYERGSRALLRQRAKVMGLACYAGPDPAVPVYLWAPLVTRWAATQAP